METKHTPGPWEFEPECPYGYHINAGDTWIATANNSHGESERFPDDETAKCNANLIAAAPDLLEALRVMYGLWLGDYHSKENVMARKAIAKAYGDKGDN